MSVLCIGIIMNGVTGRMGANQHLRRSIVAIIEQGGVKLPDGTAIIPKPLLVGRNAAKLQGLAHEHSDLRWTTDLDEALADPQYSIYFDAQTTDRRAEAVRKAIEAGKHVYCEKPSASSVRDALELYQQAKNAGVKQGVVQDKLWLPGLQKLRRLRERDFFGRILSVRGEFGYWVFDGASTPAQRPSWNYRKEDGGGIIVDMFSHWHYVLTDLFGEVRAVSCRGATHIPERWDENQARYAATADDAAYATFELEDGAIAHFNSSWCVRVRRDDLLAIQVDGTNGSAVAGLRDCWIQPAGNTPRAVWNPDVENPHDYSKDWEKLDTGELYDNAFKSQWELFLRHVVAGDPFRWSLLEGARGVQLAEKALESWRKRAWVSVPKL